MQRQVAMDWNYLAACSPYQTAVAIAEQLAKRNIEEAEKGLQELIEVMASAHRRELRSQLVRLMVHIIKWKCQPRRRSRSWVTSIIDARYEIEEIQEEIPSLTQDRIEEMWDRAFKMAMRQAEVQMRKKAQITGLSWAEVFETEYSLRNESDGEHEA